MKFIAVKHLGSLRPVDAAGEEALHKLGTGQLVEVEIKRPRNIKFHRMYWALVTLVWENLDQDRYPAVEDLHAAIKIAAGLRTQIVLPDGAIGFIPGSIAFHKMDDTAFSEFFDRVCLLIAKHFLPGVTDEELRHEVALIIGVTSDQLGSRHERAMAGNA